MMATMWHNPRCSKSRETLQILLDAGVEVKLIEYLKDPPSRLLLAAMYEKAGMRPRDGLRTSEPAAKPLADASDDEILDAMAANPTLIERPMVEIDYKVRLYRPPEKVRELF